MHKCTCPFGHGLTLSSDQIGKSVACPACGMRFVVPGIRDSADATGRLADRSPRAHPSGRAARLALRNQILAAVAILAVAVAAVVCGAAIRRRPSDTDRGTTSESNQVAANDSNRGRVVGDAGQPSDEPAWPESASESSTRQPATDRPAASTTQNDESRRAVYRPTGVTNSGVEPPVLGETPARPTTVVQPSGRAVQSGPSLSAAGRSQVDVRTGQAVDFQPLIDLIQSVIEPNSWDAVGGAGSAEGFAGGVWIDVRGRLQRRSSGGDAEELARIRERIRPATVPTDAGNPARMRLISLPRLERRVGELLAAGHPLPDEIRYLAGLQQVRHIFIYPDEHDIVIAGPADGWRIDDLGRPVGEQSGRPVLLLDDLVTVLRTCLPTGNGAFGCGIFPRRERLARVHEFLASAPDEVVPARREAFLRQIRDELGEQDIRVWGVAPGSHVGQVLVEADHHMKLIGIGLEDGGPDVPSYLSMLDVPPGGEAPAMDTLRWWFTQFYDDVLTTPTSDAFQIRGQGVQVQSENELITPLGDRVHTGASQPNNERFAHGFTTHFDQLAERYVIYHELRNLFDLAVLSALLVESDAASRIQWDYGCFADPKQYRVPLQPAPRTVETVLNHRVIRERHILAAVSGGVVVNPWPTVKHSVTRSNADGLVRPAHRGDRWWWE